MSFPDPITITINSVAETFNCVSPGENRSVYKTADGEFTLTLSHMVSGNKTRHLVRLDQRVLAEDPLTAVNAYKDQGTYLVIEEPDFGFSDSEIDLNVQGLVSFLTSANVTDVLEGQH